MRKARKHLHKVGAKESRIRCIRTDEWNSTTPSYSRTKVESDAAKRYDKHSYDSRKAKLKNQFHKTKQSFLGPFARSGLRISSHSCALNMHIAGAKHDRSSMSNVDIWRESPDGKNVVYWREKWRWGDQEQWGYDNSIDMKTKRNAMQRG